MQRKPKYSQNSPNCYIPFKTSLLSLFYSFWLVDPQTSFFFVQNSLDFINWIELRLGLDNQILPVENCLIGGEGCCLEYEALKKKVICFTLNCIKGLEQNVTRRASSGSLFELYGQPHEK